VFRIGGLGCCQSSHAGVGDLLNSDQLGIEKGNGFGPDGLVEWVWVGEEGIGSTGDVSNGQKKVSRKMYLREISCSRIWSRPRSLKSKELVKGYLGLVRMACVNRRTASPRSMLKPVRMPSASVSRSMFLPFRGR
jgi:hypothetical protein